jgi:hypothetical protein
VGSYKLSPPQLRAIKMMRLGPVQLYGPYFKSYNSSGHPIDMREIRRSTMWSLVRLGWVRRRQDRGYELIPERLIAGILLEEVPIDEGGEDAASC